MIIWNDRREEEEEEERDSVEEVLLNLTVDVFKGQELLRNNEYFINAANPKPHYLL